MPESPLAALAQLAKTVRDIGARYGLDMRMFLTEPDIDGTAHKAKLVFTVDEDRVTSKPAPVVDPALEEMWQRADEVDMENKIEEGRSHLEGLEERLRDPKKGLLDE